MSKPVVVHAVCKIFRLDEIIREIREPQRERYGSPQRMVSIPADSDTRLSLSPRLSQKVCDIFVIVCVCLCNILITILCVSCVSNRGAKEGPKRGQRDLMLLTSCLQPLALQPLAGASL